MAVVDSGDRIQARQSAARFVTPVDIGAPGHQIPIHWNPVAGATKAEVSNATLTISPAVVEESTTDAPVKADSRGWIVTVPAKKRVRTLGLSGFKQPDGEELTSSLPEGMRIAVAFPKDGAAFDSPRFSVPAVGKKGEVPQTLTGATFSNRVLTLTPSVAASRVRIALVTGDNPLEFDEQETQLDSVNLTTHTTARNATVVIDDGAPQWQMPEYDPGAPDAEIDLRAGLETALNRKLKAQQTPQTTITISADAPANMVLRFPAPIGFLVRTEAGVLKATLEGDPTRLALGSALAAEIPSSVTGGLTIHYAGIRILETVSDPVPAPGAALRGVIVGTESAVHAFPPDALKGIEPARVGIYGRAPEDCEIAIEFVQMIGDTVGKVLGPPAVLQLKQDNTMRTRWADVSKGTRINEAAGLRVRANRGRFFWVTTTDGRSIARLAINDPEPGGRAVNIGGVKLVDVHEAESHLPTFSFPVAAFRGAAPAIDSNLFMTIDFSDLTMRYAR